MAAITSALNISDQPFMAHLQAELGAVTGRTSVSDNGFSIGWERPERAQIMASRGASPVTNIASTRANCCAPSAKAQ